MTNREFFNALVNGTLITKEKNEKGEMIENERSIFDENGFNLSDEIKAFASECITKLDNKNKKRSKNLTTKQKDNISIKDNILSLMTDNEKRSAKMIADEYNISTQKASALLKQLVDNNKLTVTVEKFNGSSSKVNVYKLI